MKALHKSAAIMRLAILLGAFSLVFGAMALSDRVAASAALGVTSLVIGLGLVLFGLFVASARRMIVGLDANGEKER